MQSQATRISRIESPGTLSGSSEFIPIHPMNLPLRPDLPRRPSDSDGRGRREQLERHEHERLGRPAEQNRQQRGRMSDRPQEMRRSEQPSRQEPVDQSGRLSPRDGRSARDPNRQPRGRGRGDMSQTDMQEQRTAVGAVEVHQTRLANIQAEEFGASRDRSPYPEGPQRRHDGGRSPRDDRRQRVPRNESPVTEQAHLPERPDRDARRPQPLRHDEPPTGPRANFADKRSADNRQANSNQSYGRLTQDGRFPNRQNEGIERPHDAPSGPRRGGGSMRPPLATGPRNQSPQATQVLHDVPPSGPSHRQNRSISTSDVSNQAVLAQPSDGSNTAGMHPDRLKQVMTPSVDSSQRFPQSAIGLNPPSGPRASARSVRPPPRSNERSRDGNRSQIQHVQQILHSSTQGSVDQNSEGTPIRGRGAQRQPTVNIPDTMTEKRSELFPDDATLARPGDKKDEPPRQFRGGRRGELMDEFSDQRKPPRASSSRTHSSERGDRTSETGRDREKDRDREHDAHRRHDDDHFRPSSRKDDHRERHRNVDRERERPRGRDHDRERDRDRDRDRGRDLPPDGGSRGDQMRRGEPSSGVNREIVGASGRGRRDNFDRNEKRVAPLNEAIVHPLPPGPRPEERTRDRESHRPRDRDRTERERDNVRDRERPRERDRDRNRDRDRDTDPANPPPNGSGNWPRKRNRPSTAMEGGGPEGAGPARYGHDNKRPRRGH
ncbi:THO complex subunit 2 [Ascosphaera aggregata]|nr:THO complex subunit 2 [Ascosphaera aggregata]